MATVVVHEISLTRSDPPVLPARVLVHEIALTRTPAEAPGPTVTVHAVWLTKGNDPPVHPGGVFAIRNGAWVESNGIFTPSGTQWQ